MKRRVRLVSNGFSRRTMRSCWRKNDEKGHIVSGIFSPGFPGSQNILPARLLRYSYRESVRIETTAPTVRLKGKVELEWLTSSRSPVYISTQSAFLRQK